MEEGGEGFMQKFQSALVRMNGNVGLMDDGGLLLLYSHTHSTKYQSVMLQQ